MESGRGGEIVLHRSKTYRDRLRKCKVVIDGEIVGHISAGEDRTFPVAEGEHELQLKVDWKGSPVQRVTVSPGDTLHFACGGNGAGRALLDLFRPAEAWIRLEPIAE